MRFHSSTAKRIFQFPVFLTAIFFCAGNIWALGLGDLSVRSHLGARFSAEVQLVESAGGTHPSENCFRLGYSGESDGSIPTLVNGRIRIERQNGQAKLVITSDQTINDPVLQLNLHAGCGAEIVRSYTLLMDPAPSSSPEPAKPAVVSLPLAVGNLPEARRTSSTSTSPKVYPTVWQTVEGESAQSIAKALFARQPKAQYRFLKALQAENPALDLGVRGEMPLDAGTALNIPDTRRLPATLPIDTSEQPAQAQEKQKSSSDSVSRKKTSIQKPDGQMADRLVISGNSDEETPSSEFSLRSSTELSTHLSDKISENSRALLRVEYRLLNSLYTQAEQQLAVAEQIRDLEANFEALRLATENAGHGTEVSTATDRPDASAPAPVASSATNLPPPAATETPKSRQEESSIRFLEVLIVLGLIAALTLIFIRSTGRHKPEASSVAADAFPEQVRDGTAKGTSWAEQTKLEVPSFAQASGASLALPTGEATTPVPTPETLSATDDKHDLQLKHIEMDEAGDYNTVMELAEIMVSFGRIKGAIQALEEFLENEPSAALAPWLKLLEIYRMNDMREEFEASSAKLKAHFNVSPTAWDSAGECLKESIAMAGEKDLSIETLLEKLPTIVATPHLKENIQNVWDSPDGMDYLKNLLSDTRDGSRDGFPLPLARELLFLIDLLETRVQNKA